MLCAKSAWVRHAVPESPKPKPQPSLPRSHFTSRHQQANGPISLLICRNRSNNKDCIETLDVLWPWCPSYEIKWSSIPSAFGRGCSRDLHDVCGTVIYVNGSGRASSFLEREPITRVFGRTPWKSWAILCTWKWKMCRCNELYSREERLQSQIGRVD